MHIHITSICASKGLIGASISEPHHTIWRLEMVPCSMHETNTSRNGNDCSTCCPLLCVDHGICIMKQT